jgi:Zn-dependent peptidase ImmA (M78 family)
MIKSFELGPYTWKVRLMKRLREKALGWCVFDSNKKEIQIKESLSEEAKQHTFYHELTHGILYVMEHPLAEDEEFVTKFSDLLYQYEKTKC